MPEYYEIYTRRAKTNHETRIVCEAQNLWPYLNPFDSIIMGNEDEEELEDYVFPIFDKDNESESAKFGRMTYATYLVNVNLKRVAKKLGFAETITFYSARHSYASNLYHANVPVGLIAQNMGRNPADIQTYLKEFDSENIIAANEKALITGQDDFMTLREKAKKERRDKKLEEMRQANNPTDNKDK